MVFKYNQKHLNEYKRNKIFKTAPLILLAFITAIVAFYFTSHEMETAFFTILFIFAILGIITGVQLYIKYRMPDKEFDTYQIECQDGKIIITSKWLNKIIDISKIKKISRDYKNNFFIETGNFSKIKILNYLENIEEFELFLSNIRQIEFHTATFSFLQYIPFFSYFIWVYIAKTGNIQLYLIFGSFIILTTIFSIVKTIFDQFKIITKIINIAFNGIILILVGRGMYIVINYLMN